VPKVWRERADDAGSHGRLRLKRQPVALPPAGGSGHALRQAFGVPKPPFCSLPGRVHLYVSTARGWCDTCFRQTARRRPPMPVKPHRPAAAAA